MLTLEFAGSHIGLLEKGANPAMNKKKRLLRAGLAWWYRRFARDDTELARLEAEARDARQGLWASPNPVPPWEWRRNGRARVVASGRLTTGQP